MEGVFKRNGKKLVWLPDKRLPNPSQLRTEPEPNVTSSAPGIDPVDEVTAKAMEKENDICCRILTQMIKDEKDAKMRKLSSGAGTAAVFRHIHNIVNLQNKVEKSTGPMTRKKMTSCQAIAGK